MAIKSHGVAVTIGGTAIGSLTDVSPGGGDVTLVETTTHSSGAWKQYVGGLKDGGSLELTGKYAIADTGQAALRTNFGTVVAFVVTFSDGSTATFDGIPGGFNVSNPLDDATEFTCSVKITDDVVYAAAA